MLAGMDIRLQLMSLSMLWFCQGCGGPDRIGPEDSSAIVHRPTVAQVGVESEAVEELSGRSAPRAIDRKPLHMSEQMANRCRSYRPLAKQAGHVAGVDPLSLLAIAWVESRFNPEARSSAGAVGLMQLMKRTGAAFGCIERKDPECSFRGGAALYARLMKRFKGRELYALCAYNAGAGRIRDAWRHGRAPFNHWYAQRVLEARARLSRDGCVGR
jgi:hypothetical protein